MFSPLVLQDILHGGGEALTLHQQIQNSPIYAANLSASFAGKEEGLSEESYQDLTTRLLDHSSSL